MEGLVIDKGVTFADLKGTLELFAKKMFGEKVKTKFRPHHFPFTEPSAEMDATCFVCGGEGCRAVSYTHLDVYKRQALYRCLCVKKEKIRLSM